MWRRRYRTERPTFMNAGPSRSSRCFGCQCRVTLKLRAGVAHLPWLPFSALAVHSSPPSKPVLLDSLDFLPGNPDQRA